MNTKKFKEAKIQLVMKLRNLSREAAIARIAEDRAACVKAAAAKAKKEDGGPCEERTLSLSDFL